MVSTRTSTGSVWQYWENGITSFDLGITRISTGSVWQKLGDRFYEYFDKLTSKQNPFNPFNLRAKQTIIFSHEFSNFKINNILFFATLRLCVRSLQDDKRCGLDMGFTVYEDFDRLSQTELGVRRWEMGEWNYEFWFTIYEDFDRLSLTEVGRCVLRVLR